MNESTPHNSDADEKWLMQCLSNRWVLIVITIVLMVIIFYVEENWRGIANWSNAQAEIASAGESLDPNKFIPPPVPEDQNFGALPIFQLQSDSSSMSPNMKIADAMKQALIHVPPLKIPTTQLSDKGSQLPYAGNWVKGESVDVATVRKRLVEAFQSELAGTPIPAEASPAEIVDLLCPALSELRAASVKYPYCRFNEDYTTMPPFNRPLVGVVSEIGMAKLLSYQERLAFWGNQPNLAFNDLKIGWKINSGVQQEPSLIAGLVAMGVVAIEFEAVRQGLAQHLWNDQQLADLDADLAKIDFLKESQLCVRGDTAVHDIPNLDYLKKHPLLLQQVWELDASPRAFGSAGEYLQELFKSCLLLSIPAGWFDDFKADAVRFNLLGVVKMIDPAAHRVYPEREAAALRLTNKADESEYWHDLMKEIFPSTLASISKFAMAQVHVDEARIACRLERYRLAHGTYPDKLENLVPAFGSELPHDVMNGEPYRYKRLDDGTYQLYSVGWNQKDDGGQDSDLKDAPDWVWLNRPLQKEAK